MEVHFVPIALHLLSRKLLLFKLLWERTCRGISLITQELFLIMYVCRYLDLLYLYVDLGNTVIKVLQLGAALAVVVLMRFSTAVAETYDVDLDTLPRWVFIVPTLLLACFANKVALPMEICHTFSLYLEAVVLLPQFVLLYKREKYDTWVVVWLLATGGERLFANLGYLSDVSIQMQDNPYGLVAAAVHAVLFLAGVVVLGLQRLRLKQQAGLNEAGMKPAFDEVWEAAKFKFDEAELGRAGGVDLKERQPLIGRHGENTASK